MEKMSKEKAKLIIQQELEDEKEKLKVKILKLMDSSKGSIQYNRRLDKIYMLLKEKLMYEGDYKKLLHNADFYQKIELFMNYDREKVKETGDLIITTDIDTLIGEVFKSLYINFILSFLEDEKGYFNLPYLGKLRVKEVRRFHPLQKQIISFFYGRVLLDEDLRKDLKKILDEEKIKVIDDVLQDTRKALYEKIY